MGYFRRSWIQKLLLPGQHAVTLAVFPSLGIGEQFTAPHFLPSATATQSYMLPPEIRSPLTRYRILEENIKASRSNRLEAHIPIFRDIKTPWPFQDRVADLAPKEQHQTSPILKENCIHLDGFGFAGGSCGLHVTLQVKNESEARWLHDQLIPLSPIMLALTASSPIHKGFLADIDVRWRCFTATVDEHTASHPKDVRHINDFIPRGT